MAGEINTASTDSNVSTTSTINSASVNGGAITSQENIAVNGQTSAAATSSSAAAQSAEPAELPTMATEPAQFVLAYLTYASRQDNGEYALPIYVPSFAHLKYPFTYVDVPEELRNKEHRFDWGTQQWVDAGTDPTTVAIKKLNKMAATLALQNANNAITAQKLNQSINLSNRATAAVALSLAKSAANAKGGE